jgi:hypothetical protein
MAKKKPKPPAKAKPKPSAARASAPRAAPPALPVAKFVLFYELRGVAGVRFHGEYADLERARLTAQHLTASSDVEQAWILKDLEVFRAPEPGTP